MGSLLLAAGSAPGSDRIADLFRKRCSTARRFGTNTICSPGRDAQPCSPCIEAERNAIADGGRPAVESRLGAGAGHAGRPGSQPRSSNRTCGFPASGFPTAFIADSRSSGAQRPPKPVNSQRPVRLFHRKRASALRRHLVPPSQEMPCPLFRVFVDRPIRPRRAPQSEVCFPASQLLIQPVPHFLPRSVVAGDRCSPTFRFISLTLFFDGLRPKYSRPVRPL